MLRDGPAATEAKALLGAAFRPGWGAKRGAHGFDRGSGADPDSPKARAARAMQAYVDNFEQTPVVVLAVHRALARAAHLRGRARSTRRARTCCWRPGRSATAGVLSMWHALVEDDLRRVLQHPRRRGDRGHDHARACPRVVTARSAACRCGDVVFDDTWGGEAAWAVDPPDTRFTGAGPSREA